MAEALREVDAPPPVPGFWRLGWLLFMRPLTLHRLFAAWGLEDDQSLRELRGRLREGDLVVRVLVSRLSGWLLLVMPVSTGAVVGSLALVGLPVGWRGVAVGIVSGIGVGLAVGVRAGIGGGTAFGFAFGLAAGITLGINFGGALDDAIVVLGVAFGCLLGFAFAGAFGFARSFSIGVLIGMIITIAGIFGLGFFFDVPSIAGTLGVAVGVGFFLAFFRIPFYLVELILTGTLRLAARLLPTSLPRLATLLPYHYHELIYLPLPLLSGILVKLGEEHPTEGRRALAEAAASLGQKGPARRALVELQARSLERAAREKRYASTAALTLPFLPERESLAIGEFNSGRIGYLVAIKAIAAAAQDLEAARSTGSHHQRRQSLTRARKELEQILYLLTSTRLTRAERRFLPVVKQWLDRVEDEEAALARLEQEKPQVPLVFVAGPALTPVEESLFVGRRDLVRLLDQDLAAERPVPLVLLGQRRMGKSTLLNFLPRLLGTGTRVVRLDFQGLSGHPQKGEPHRWVAVDVASALAIEKIEAPSPTPEEAPWMATLDWLSSLEEPLAASERRLLIALDEVEGLERGIREKWSDPAFLDFLRAAGDRLHRSRFLLVTAHPFSRLGPHWSDRLISAQTRRIEPLAEEEARVLLTRPVDGFPDIYPSGGVERFLTETACHPYLLQLTRAPSCTLYKS